MKVPSILLFLFLVNPSLWGLEPANLVTNPSFEMGTQGWSGFWGWEEGKGTATLVDSPAHQASHSLKIEYAGARDWSFGQQQPLPVKPGEVYVFSGWVKIEKSQGAGQGQLSVVTRDAQGQVLDWLWGLKNSTGDHDWALIQGRFMVPQGCSTAQFRITGEGTATTYWDGLSLTKVIEAPQVTALRAVTLVSSGTQLSYSPEDKELRLSHLAGTTFVFQGFGDLSNVTSLSKISGTEMDLSLTDPNGNPLSASLTIDQEGSVLVSLRSTDPQAPLDQSFQFPGALTSVPGQNWVVPLNEGLYVPADDPYFQTGELVLYGGHGLSMPFLGLTHGKDGLLAIAETQNDARVRFASPAQGRGSTWSFLWEASRQVWGYERKLRLVFVPQGGYVGIAKAYRAYAKTQGLLSTLKEKAVLNPFVKKIVGAVDLWWWRDGPSWQEDGQPQDILQEMKAAGIERVLWSHEQSPEVIKTLEDLGYLSGRYDIYQDVWGPDDPSSWNNKEGWPDCLTFLPNGDWMKGWVDRVNGKEYPGGVLCSSCILDMAKRHIPADLTTHPYQARFVDTTTASPLRECYNPKHPLTRAQDRENKMALLDYISKDLKLVEGSETGMDMAVPHLDYFEGMMSLGPYRLPDSGYDLFSYKKPQEDLLRFQVGPYYRIPLFELVYHDCVVNYWYWGDSSNRLPECWDARDLFNALYGTPPMWSMDRSLWAKEKDRFIQSYKTAVPVAQRTGGLEMLSHVFLTEDHQVQMSVFADGTKVWVNFGDKPYGFKNGAELKPKGYRVVSP